MGCLVEGCGATVGQDVRADLGFGTVVFGQRGDRDPAFGAQCRGFLRQGAQRQEQAAAFILRQPCVNQRIGISGKSDGWLIANPVAAAPPDFPKEFYAAEFAIGPVIDPVKSIQPARRGLNFDSWGKTEFARVLQDHAR